MIYRVIGVYSKSTGSNCELGDFNSFKKANAHVQSHANGLQFEAFYILTKARKNAFPFEYTVFNKAGDARIAGIMAQTLKPAFWLNENNFKAMFTKGI